MRKIIIIASAVLLSVTSAVAAASVFCVYNDDKPIQFNELPAPAKEFVGKHFGKEQVSYVTVDNDIICKNYTLIFLSGTKIEFDGKGEWHEIDCRYDNVPAELVPVAIAKYVKDSHPTSKITELKRDRNTWEVKLTGGLELTFNNDFRLIEVDD